MKIEEIFKKYSDNTALSEGNYAYMIDEESFTDACKILISYHVKTFAQKIHNSSIDDITTWYGNPYTEEGSISLDINKILNVYPEDLIQ